MNLQGLERLSRQLGSGVQGVWCARLFKPRLTRSLRQLFKAIDLSGDGRGRALVTSDWLKGEKMCSSCCCAGGWLVVTIRGVLRDLCC